MDHVALPASWASALGPVLDTPALRALDEFLAAAETDGRTIYPPRDSRLRALELTPLQDVRVVILGQDPYHGSGQAMGLAFAVSAGVRIPPSLANVFNEVTRDLGIPRPMDGDLTPWAQQGVLLLNTVLTVEEGRAGSHRGRGWEKLTDAAIAAVAASAQPTVFMLWGSDAQTKAALIAAHAGTEHLVLKAPHPSPLSAYRGFLGCGHFGKANEFLRRGGRGTIAWDALRSA